MFRVEGATGQSGDCGRVFYNLIESNATVRVRNAGLDGEPPNQTVKDIHGGLTCPDAEN